MSKWIAEQVEFGWLIPNTPFYLVNPIEHPDARPHYTCEALDADTDVWTLYEPWQPDNPWLTKEARRGPEPTGDLSHIGRAMFSGLDHSLAGG